MYNQQFIFMVKQQDIDFGDLKDRLGFHLRRSGAEFNRIFARTLGEYGLRAQQYPILILIDRNPGISPADIAEFLYTKRSLLVVLIDELIEKGLVERTVGKEDKRKRNLHLSNQGRRFLKKCQKTALAEMESQLSAPYTKTERATLIKLLRKLYERP